MPRKKLRIVAIDDNPADAGIVRRYLERIRSFDVDFVHCLSGDEGRNGVIRDGADCVLLDYELGAVSGMEVLTHIRQSGSDVPIIAATGQGNEAVVAEYFRRGAQEYLVKSDIDAVSLEAAIDSAIQKVEDERRRREKEQELESFVSIVAHDLQTPLCAIKGNLDLIQDFFSESLGEEGRKFVQSAVRMSTRMSEMIEGLLAYSRVGRSQTPMGPVSLDQCVAGAIASLEPTIQETGAEIRYSNLPAVWGDGMALGQLMQNLVGNALKYRSKDRPVIEIGAELELAAWRCWVRDNGIGVEREYRKDIFSPFTRVPGHKVAKGSGIGLATCKKIIDHHQGRIWIESRRGEGSTFYFLLRPVEEGASAMGSRVERGRVLVLDDEESIRQLLDEALTMRGYHVAGAASPTEAMELAESGRFDFLIAHIAMPDGTGLDVVREIRHRNPDMRFIAVLGGGGDETPSHLLRQAQEAGAEFTFTKPFPLEEMTAAVDKLIQTPMDYDKSVAEPVPAGNAHS